MKKIISLSVIYWADDWFLESIDSIIDFVDESVIWHNYYPYSTSSLSWNEDQHKKVLQLIEKIKEKHGDKIKYVLNKKPYTSVGITDLINNELLFKEYANDDMIMYVDGDEIFIPEQLKRIRNLVLSDSFDQYKIFQRHYIKYPNLWMPCPTNPYQTFITRNVKLPSYIRNHKNIKTYTLSEDKFYYRHMAYCPKNWEDLKTKLINNVGCESGITISNKWYDEAFDKINQKNYKEFKNFSFIKEYPHHMPFINNELE